MSEAAQTRQPSGKTQSRVSSPVGHLITRVIRQLVCFAFLGWFVLCGLSVWKWTESNADKALIQAKQFDKAQQQVIKGTPSQRLLDLLDPVLLKIYQELYEDLDKTIPADPVDWSLSQWAVDSSERSREYKQEKSSLSRLSASIAELRPLLILMLISCHIVLIRLLIVIGSFPGLLLSALIAVVVGLSGRAIRRAELGRESTFLFHGFNKLAFISIQLGSILLFVLPFVVMPVVILLPAWIVFGLCLTQGVARLKKYL